MPSSNAQRGPLTEHAWQAIDTEATQVLNAMLSARRLCDVVRTDDWSRSALPLGSAEQVELPHAANAKVYVREARPLIELRVPFSLDRELIRELDRQSPVADLAAVSEAAIEFANTENQILFEGIEGVNAPGLRRDAASRAISIDSVQGVPLAIAQALEALTEHGVSGPHSFIPSAALRTALIAESDSAGRPIIDHVRRAVEFVGPSARCFEGALVCSRRGGDYRLHLGRGAHVRFEWQESDLLHFSIVQSMALEFGGREALVYLEAPANLAAAPAFSLRRTPPHADLEELARNRQREAPVHAVSQSASASARRARTQKARA